MIKLDFCVVGAAKCGTSALHNYLIMNKNFSLPVEKETNYFCHNELAKSYFGVGDFKFTISHMVTSEKSYYSSFKIGGRIFGEVCPMYLYYNSTAKKLFENNDKMHIYIILRNPLDRARSHYQHMVRDGREKLTFPEAIELEPVRLLNNWEPSWLYSGLSLYSSQIMSYLQLFPRDQIHIFKYEDFLRDNDTIPRHIHKIFQLEYKVITKRIVVNSTGKPHISFLSHLINSPGSVKNIAKKILPRELLSDIKQRFNKVNFNKNKGECFSSKTIYLQKLFNDDISRLSHILGMDFSEWKEP